MLMASAGLELAYVILLAFSATEYFYYPWGLFSANLISTLILVSISLVQVLAFSLPIVKPRTLHERQPLRHNINRYIVQAAAMDPAPQKVLAEHLRRPRSIWTRFSRLEPTRP